MRPSLLPTVSLVASIAAGALASCVIVADNEIHASHDMDGVSATAHVTGKSGSSLSGHATFFAQDGGVLVTLRVKDTAPGWHAVHIHQTGDCSSADGKSAGGHFNPGGDDHGSPHASEHHAGDLGNMWVDDDGDGYHAIFMPELEISDDEFGVIGRAIIVHEGADDLTSQPTGAAGGRIGCGVIE